MIKKGAVILTLILIISAELILADLLDTSSTPSYSINVSLSNLYNISVRNTNDIQGVNFTQINITFPSGFSVDSSTAGTSASGTFVENGQTLSWTNNTDGFHLVLNGTTRYFWVNATASSTGSYNIVVTSLDTLSNTNSSNIPVTITAIADITSPSINPSPSVIPPS